jgi:thioredoxin-related protein
MNMTTKMSEVCIKEIEIIMKTTNLVLSRENCSYCQKKKFEQKEIIGEREHLLPNSSN